MHHKPTSHMYASHPSFSAEYNGLTNNSPSIDWDVLIDWFYLICLDLHTNYNFLSLSSILIYLSPLYRHACIQEFTNHPIRFQSASLVYHSIPGRQPCVSYHSYIYLICLQFIYHLPCMAVRFQSTLSLSERKRREIFRNNIHVLCLWGSVHCTILAR